MANFDDFYLPRVDPAFVPATASANGVTASGAQYSTPLAGNVRPAAGQSVVTTKVGRFLVPIAVEGFHTQ